MSIFFIISLLIEFFLLSFFKNTFFSFDIGIVLTTINIIITIFYMSIKKHSFKLPILLGYIVRIALMFVDLYGRNLIKILHSGVDTEAFYRISLIYSKGDFSVFGNNTPRGYYPKVLGSIFYYVGDQRIFAQYLNIVLSILTIIILIRILDKLNIEKNVQSVVIWIVSLFPTNLFLSSILLRESLILFLVTYGIYHYIDHIYSNNIIHLGIASMSIVLSSVFHSGTIMIILGFIVYQIFSSYGYISNFKKIAGILLIAFVLIIFNDVLLRYFYNNGSLNLGNDEILQNAGSGYLRNININNISDIIKYGWLRAIYFVASPTPLYWRGFGDIASFFTDSLLYIIIIFKILFNNVKLPQKVKSVYISLLLALAFSIFTFGIGTANAGTALRHRNKLLILFLVVFAIIESYNIDSETKRTRRVLMDNSSNSLKIIIQYIKKNIATILASIIIVGGLGYGFTKYIITPTYTSNATMMVGVSLPNDKINDKSDGTNSNLVEVNESLISTYSEIVKSRGVADQVINNLKLNMTYDDFSDKVSIEQVKDTQIISVTVVDTIPERSMDIANETANIFKDTIGDIINVDNVQILDAAVLPKYPSAPNINRNTLFSLLLGAIIGVLISVYKEISDTSIKTQDDISQYFDLPVIGIIPDKKQG